MKPPLFRIALISLLGLSLYAQPTTPKKRRLERLSELGLYTKIVAEYEKAPDQYEARLLPFVAYAYYVLGKEVEAYRLYEQGAAVGTQDWETEQLLGWAQLLHRRGQTARAKAIYQTYADRTGTHLSQIEQLERCAALSHDSTWEITRVKALEPWAPVYAAWLVEDKLYAISRAPKSDRKRDRTGHPYEWIVPESPYTYKYHHAVIGWLPPDTLLLYLSRGRGNIYASIATASGYTKPIRWRRLPVRPKGRVSLYIDPKTQDIYFVSEDRRAGNIDRNLYRCAYLGNGKYSQPELLPRHINTPYHEDAPFIVGDTMYFASNRPESAGGYDIFFSIRVGERDWTPPRPLPAPINSCANDIYFHPFSSEHTYLSSDRDGTFYVYQVKRSFSPLPVALPGVELAVPTSQRVLMPVGRPTLRGHIYDKQTGQPVVGEAILVDTITQKELYAARSSTTEPFRIFLPKEGGHYYLYVQAVGYITHVQRLELRNLPNDTVIDLSIPLLPIEMEATFALRNIYFDFNSDRLRPESIPELERLRRLLVENPNIRVRFSGHTDAIGSDTYNQKLSERRARAVYQWLKSAGIHPIQMEYIGYGKTRPVAPNTTEEGRALNRRIEMEVVGIRRPKGTASALAE